MAAVSEAPVGQRSFADDHDMDELDSDDSYEEMEKDETEVQLEKLVFGDSSGFQGALAEHGGGASTELALQADSEGEADDDEALDQADSDAKGDLAGVDDADLFFLDAGTAAAPPETSVTKAPLTGELDLETDRVPAAWEDSDDDRSTVSLAENERMRKLRFTEDDDVVTGKEYIRRLRRQFERLHATPEWANQANASRASKRRKTNADHSDTSDDESGLSGNEMDTDGEEETSLQPLARLLQNAGNLSKGQEKKSKGKRKLRQEVIDIQRLKDVGGKQPSTIDSLSFHPHYPLILSSGPASTLFLHHVSPHSASPNPLITSFHVRRTPLQSSEFAPPNGNRIFFSGRRRYFHVWDLDTGKVEKINGSADRREEQKTMERFKLSPCGRWMGIVGSTRKGGGIITILDATTMQWVAQVRVDSRGGIADFAWWSNGEGMCVVGKNGEVSEWDAKEKRIVARWVDEGAIGTTVLSLGGKSGRQNLGGDRWVAIGSSSGIVNIYDRKPWAEAAAAAAKTTQAGGAAENGQSGIPRNPKPARMLDQLTTPISHLVFSNDGQLLAMASRWKRDALRLVHLPSCTVFRNWPTSNTPFGRISAVAISPTTDVLAVANEQGKIRLWEIHG